MGLKDIFVLTKGTKVVLSITFSIALITLAFAYLYYQGLNKAEDPRVHKARELLVQFEKFSGEGIEAFPLLDSAMAIYRNIPDYAESYETGLIYNNKSSVLLMMALYDEGIEQWERDKLLSMAMLYCDSSIWVYRAWLQEWEHLSPESIDEKIHLHVDSDDPCFTNKNFSKILAKRKKDLLSAQIETPRRLSVSLTNKGTIFRHQMKLDSAFAYYHEALALWEHNRTAESNLSVLMGGEPVKPGVIESLFPPDKNKK